MRYFAACGVPTFDADQHTRQLLVPGAPATHAVMQRYPTVCDTSANMADLVTIIPGAHFLGQNAHASHSVLIRYPCGLVELS